MEQRFYRVLVGHKDWIVNADRIEVIILRKGTEWNGIKGRAVQINLAGGSPLPCFVPQDYDLFPIVKELSKAGLSHDEK